MTWSREGLPLSTTQPLSPASSLEFVWHHAPFTNEYHFRRTARQMQAIASAWPWYMQVRICICLLTVSSGKHTEAASRPEAAPSPKLWTVSVLHSQKAVTGERVGSLGQTRRKQRVGNHESSMGASMLDRTQQRESQKCILRADAQVVAALCPALSVTMRTRETTPGISAKDAALQKVVGRKVQGGIRRNANKRGPETLE